MMQMYKNNKCYNDGIILFQNMDHKLKDNASYVIGIQLYSQLNYMDNATKLFDMINDKNGYVYNAMMHAYNDHKMYQESIHLFESTEMEKFKDNISATIAMKAYSRVNNIGKCEALFDTMVNKNERVYGALMQAYNENEMYSKTVDLYWSVGMEGFRDGINANIAIHAYSQLQDIDHCEVIFDRIIKKNAWNYGALMQAYNNNKYYNKTVELFGRKEVQKCKNNVICNIAIQGYSKLNNVEACEQIFDNMANKNDVVFNSMMQVYNDHQMYDKTIQLFTCNQFSKLKNNISNSIVIQAHSKLKDIQNCVEIFTSIINKNDVLCNCMMQAYNDNEMYYDTIQLFTSPYMEKLKDNISYNIAIQAYSKLSQMENCEHLFDAIKNKNEELYGVMMQVYNDNNMYDRAIDLFVSNGLKNYNNIILCNIAMQAYNGNKMYHETIQLFTSNVTQNITSCHTVIQAYSYLNKMDDCERIFNSIGDKNEKTYGCMLQAYNDNQMYNKAIALFLSNEMEPFKDNVNSNIVMEAYLQLNDIQNCQKVFDNIQDKDILSYAAMMNAYRLSGKYEDLFDLFSSLWKVHRKLSSKVFCHALYGCTDMMLLDQGRAIIHKLNHKYNRNFINDSYVLAAIIAFHGKCSNNLNETRHIYNIIIHKHNWTKSDVHVIHTSMLDCYVKSGNMDNAFELFDKLNESGSIITDEMYSIILNCCAHTGCISKATDIFEQYIKSNIIVKNVYILNPIIDCFARNNELDKAESYYNKYAANFQNDRDKIIMLKSILASCKTHNDIERAQRILDKIQHHQIKRCSVWDVQ